MFFSHKNTHTKNDYNCIEYLGVELRWLASKTAGC